MFSDTDITRIEGSTLYDDTGDKVGKVGQVYLDDRTGQPTWVTVSTGLFGTSETFVPLEGARFEGDDLHATYSKDRIKDAPRMDVDQHLSETEEAELYRYYGLDAGAGYAAGTDNGTDTGTVTAPAATTAAPATTATDDAAVTVSEEQMVVGTESREAGRARLRKYTTTETETVTVPVTKEKLVVERNPVEGGRTDAAIDASIAEGGEVEEITLREERAVVDKETVPVEEVRIGKEQVTEHEQVSAEVRKEHVDVDGDVQTGRGTGL